MSCFPSALLSIRLPKNFQPVGTSNPRIPRRSQTTSIAEEVGIDRAQAVSPFRKYGMHRQYAATIASESDGEMKNCRPRIIARSASPSTPHRFA